MTLSKRDALMSHDPARVILVAELSEGGRRLSRSVFSFVKTKDLELPSPELQVEVEPKGEAFAVKVTARKLARHVTLTAFGSGDKVPAVDGFFDDNNFDLMPGESATVAFRPRVPTPPEAFKAALRAISIVDSYQ
jgi:beta-mannosidase